MAIDSRENRASACSVGGTPWFPPNVTPNVAKDAEWRAQAGKGYSGIITPTPTPTPPAWVGKISASGIWIIREEIG